MVEDVSQSVHPPLVNGKARIQQRQQKKQQHKGNYRKTEKNDVEDLLDSSTVRKRRNSSSSSHISKDGRNRVAFPCFSNGTAKATSSTFPVWAIPTLKLMLTGTVALYVLNQKHLLPKPLSAVVSQVLFWPTLPITASKRIGQWITKVDDTVLMGGAPIGFLKYPEKLYDEYQVRGVVNFCQEYRGPVNKYKKLGIKHLRLPTVDHFEPTVEDLMSAVAFIREMEARGQRVYVHCRAGHGRSAAAVMAWLLYKTPTADPRQLNRKLCLLRNVRRTLWNQTNLLQFQAQLLKQRRQHQQQQQQRMKQDDNDGTSSSNSDNGDEEDDSPNGFQEQEGITAATIASSSST